MKAVWCLLLLGFVQTCLSASILAVLPFPATSHGILIERLLRQLDTRGHDVTYLTAAVPKKAIGKVKIVEIPGMREKMMKTLEARSGSANMLQMRNSSPIFNLFIMPQMGKQICELAFAEEVVQTVINSNAKFDLILGENFMGESFLAGFSHKFKAPIVALQPFMPNLWGNNLVGNPAPAAFIPNPFLGFPSRMTFFQRVANFLFDMAEEIYYNTFHLRWQDELMRKNFGDDLPPIKKIMQNTSLVLVNHHFSLAFSRPYVPNMIEVGGMHIDEPRPLPKDLQTFMDDAKNGVILFSMGSNLKSSEMSPELIQSILKAFSRLKQNIIWKFEVSLDNLPKNVKIMQWLPQSDILAHPNLKLFITHGGLLSTTEAVARGVPVVGIPIFGDQPANMRHTENTGFGKTLLYDDITEDSLYNTITEVLTNPRYALVAKERSALLNDNPKPALDNAIWWIEYVLRHKGASHLRSGAQDLAWYELYLIDVYVVAAAIIGVWSWITIYITKAIFRKIFCKKCSKADSTKKTEKKTN